jgi:cell division septum initiation protein DivIVA
MSTKTVFLETVKSRLAALKADADLLQSKAERIGNEEFRQYTRTIQEILAKIQQIEKRFTADSQANVDTWPALKRKTEDAFMEIESLVKKAKETYLH